MTAVNDPTSILFEDDPTKPLEELVDAIGAEVSRLEMLLRDAYPRQYDVSPVPRPREDTRERSKGEAPPDPTGDTATDIRRLALRAQVVASERVLSDTLRRLHVVRLGLQRKIDWWDGE